MDLVPKLGMDARELTKVPQFCGRDGHGVAPLAGANRHAGQDRVSVQVIGAGRGFATSAHQSPEGGGLVQRGGADLQEI